MIHIPTVHARAARPGHGPCMESQANNVNGPSPKALLVPAPAILAKHQSFGMLLRPDPGRTRGISGFNGAWQIMRWQCLKQPAMTYFGIYLGVGNDKFPIDFSRITQDK